MAVLRRVGSNFFSRSISPRLKKKKKHYYPCFINHYAIDNSLLERFGKTSDVHQSHNVDGKLKQDGKQHVKVENVTQRPLLGQFLNRLINLVFSSLSFLFVFFFKRTLALEIHKKQTLINIPVMVTW